MSRRANLPRDPTLRRLLRLADFLRPRVRERVVAAVRAGLEPTEAARLADRLEAIVRMDPLPAVVASWCSPGGLGLSEHLYLEIVASAHRSCPLEAGEPVPGCACARCTGVAEDDPARVDGGKGQAGKRPALPVEEARRVDILAVACRLGLSTPEPAGTEYRVRCPFHNDHDPSLYLNADRNVWYCHVCAEGGDGIGLYMLASGVDFVTAVKELASGPAGAHVPAVPRGAGATPGWSRREREAVMAEYRARGPTPIERLLGRGRERKEETA